MDNPGFETSAMIFSRKQHGFTLIELITVIAIIMILMGLLLPAVNSVKEAAKRTQAKNDVTHIVAAVNAYYTEYGRYPLLDAQASAPNDAIFGAPTGANGTNDQLINVLCCPVWWNDPQNGASDPQNPKKIQFLSVNNAKSITAPKGGIATVAANPGPDKAPINQGAFVDPWGDPYIVFMDNNYDNNTQGEALIIMTGRLRAWVSASRHVPWARMARGEATQTAL
ncbi:MAG: prepilin-type N-terminal cleavage/methylation domain-containing protein [Verrucomicrobiota bacterium]